MSAIHPVVSTGTWMPPTQISCKIIRICTSLSWFSPAFSNRFWGWGRYLTGGCEWVLRPTPNNLRSSEDELERHRISWLRWRVQLTATSLKMAVAKAITAASLFRTRTIPTAPWTSSKEIPNGSPLCSAWNWRSTRISRRILPRSCEIRRSSCNRKPNRILTNSNEYADLRFSFKISEKLN